MKLDYSQPWMSNHVIKVRILQSRKLADNPAIRAYQEEFNSLQLVEKEFSNVSRR